jgi:hypothetical protein
VIEKELGQCHYCSKHLDFNAVEYNDNFYCDTDCYLESLGHEYVVFIVEDEDDAE